jgi:SAM-dependent methyltransferase
MTDNRDGNPIQTLIETSYAAGDATGWFEQLYAAADRGEATVPWDRSAPHPVLQKWAARGIAGEGRPAVVVGCGTGDDAALAAAIGYATTAFDISASAVAAARRRYPDARITFVEADLFALPAGWRQAFSLVVESQTVQALPRTLREAATAAVASLVAPGGTLVVQAVAATDDVPLASGPPWPLTRAEIDRFASHGLDPVTITQSPGPSNPDIRHWLAEFTRPLDPI